MSGQSDCCFRRHCPSLSLFAILTDGHLHGGVDRPSNLSFVRAKRAFQFVPRGGPARSGGGLAKSGTEQPQQGVSDEHAQDAFEQVIAELGPQLRKQLGKRATRCCFGHHAGSGCRYAKHGVAS